MQGFDIKKKVKIEQIITNDKQCVDQRKMNKINDTLGNISFVLLEYQIYQGIAKHSHYVGIGPSIKENYQNIWHYNNEKVKYFETIQGQFGALKNKLGIPTLKL